jgi:hypothetical protein
MSWTRLINKIKSKEACIFGIPVPLHLVLPFLLFAAVLYGSRSWINRDDWKTLVHEQYSFSIDYPANWGYELFGERGNKGVQHVKAIATSFPFGPIGPSKAFQAHWIAIDNPTLTQAAEWGLDILPPYGGDPYKGTLSSLQETQVGIDHYPALTRTFQYADSSAIEIYYYVVRENGAYSLEFYLKNEDDLGEAKSIFNQMLLSFRMLDWSE